MDTQQQEYESLPIWRNYVDDQYTLYYVDYRDNLDGHTDLINKCVQENNLSPICENIDDWWDFPEGYELEEIKKSMEDKGFEYVYEECYEDIRDWLWDHDTSTPVDDLLGNTGHLVFFYDLGIEVDGWHEGFLCTPWRGESEAQAAYKIRRKLGIKKGTKEAEQIYDMCCQASGGHLRIYFESELQDLLKDDDQSDWKSIRFKGRYNVALYDPMEGSGDYVTIELDRTFSFNRANLFLSDKSVDRYTLQDAWGMCYDWCSRTETPFFSMETTKKGKCKTSSTNALAAQEAEYERVFKAGGCTRGDTNIKRHRDVYYKNIIPCGLHCPHCGQFWID